MKNYFDSIAQKKSFASDNNSGVHPEILRAIEEANAGHVVAYGDDPYTGLAKEKFREHFGENIDVYFVFNGTAANVLGIQALTRSYHAVICAEVAHLNEDECGAPEKFTGCKLLTVDSDDGKITVEDIQRHLHDFGNEHHVQPRVVSLTQATEMGTVYSPEEIRAIADLVHRYDMFLHMDGARIANAAAGLNVSLREITADAGVDVLSFGGTKNGMMFGEAIVFFNPELSRDFKYYRKQGMQLGSKMRFIAAQFVALLSHDLWRKNAAHANRMARLLEEKVKAIPGVRLPLPVQANGVFPVIPPEVIPRIQEKYFFYIWDEAISQVRWMCSFDTTEEEVNDFVREVREAMR